jgi:uncharacterized repeat protein (TIGR02543 family)
MNALKKIFTASIFMIILGISLSACVGSVKFTLYFDSNGGTEVSPILTDGSSTVSMPENPTKEGFIFDGWYWDNNIFSQPFTANSLIDSPLSTDMTVYAKWEIIPNDIPTYSDETIISISVGGNFSMAITSSGRLFSWGENYYGQLGDGTTTDKYTPTDITGRIKLSVGEKIISIKLGYSNSLAISSTGSVFTWGNNKYGQLGNGTTSNEVTPSEITSSFNLGSGDPIISISLGNSPWFNKKTIHLLRV